MTLAELLAALALWQAAPLVELPADWPTIVDPFDPLAASALVDAAFRDVPPGFVVDTCVMESSCYASILVGIHEVDIEAGARAYARALVSGRLRPGRCDLHQPGDELGRWSTRGAHGLMAAFNLYRLGDCLPPEVLDVPLFSALAAGRKARYLCGRLARRGKRCTRLRLRCAWAMAPLGTRACGKVIRRWKKRLRKYKSIRTDVAWDRLPRTVGEFRRRWVRDGGEDVG